VLKVQALVVRFGARAGPTRRGRSRILATAGSKAGGIASAGTIERNGPAWPKTQKAAAEGADGLPGARL